MTPPDTDSYDTCQMLHCERPASGQYTRRMYASSEGEEWPDDVSERPICWRHHWFEELMKAAIATAVFMLIGGIGIGVIFLVF